MDVSIIIPIRHNDPYVDRCVNSVKYCTYKGIEIIVVDEGLERSAQRNIGIERSKGEYLLFLDSDMTIHRKLIEECIDWLTISDDNALYIREIITTKGFFGRLRNWERQFYTNTPVDCVRFVRAKGCPRFDETMSGPEDADWSNRIKGNKGIAAYPLYHCDNVGLVRYLKKKAYYTKSMVRYKEKNPNDKVLNWEWRCFGIFFEQDKYKRVLKRPDLMFLIWCLIFIRGIIYLNGVALKRKVGGSLKVCRPNPAERIINE